MSSPSSNPGYPCGVVVLCVLTLLVVFWSVAEVIAIRQLVGDDPIVWPRTPNVLGEVKDRLMQLYFPQFSLNAQLGEG
jgi:hypothetical protein